MLPPDGRNTNYARGVSRGGDASKRPVTLAEPRGNLRQALGLRGEEVARRTLEEAGLTVLERRYRRRFGEIDIVARCGELIVFVEVKTRSGAIHGAPAHAVTPLKQRRLSRVAAAYLQQRRLAHRPCRFDVVEVTRDHRGRLAARHIADAFRLWPTG